MNLILPLLGEAPLLRYAVNLALAAATAALFGLLIVRATRRRAALRHGVLVATVAVLAVLPLSVLAEWGGGLWYPPEITQHWDTDYVADKNDQTGPSLRPEEITSPRLLLPSTLPSSAGSVSPLANDPPSDGGPTSVPLRTLLWAGTLVWGLGCLISALSVGRRLAALHRLRRGSVAAGPEWDARAEDAAEAVGTTILPRIAFSLHVVVPCVLAGRDPVILLPESVQQMDEKEAEAILLHEAGHLAHRHGLLGALMAFVGTLYWWLAPVRRVNDLLADAMEEVCDNHVIRVQGDGLALGRCLIRSAEAMQARRLPLLPGSAILHGERGLPRRLARVLERNSPRETRLTRSGLAVSLVVALSSFSLCAVARVGPALVEWVRDSASDYFPLTAGTEWKYNLTVADQAKPTEQSLRVWRRLTLKDGKTCAELESRYDNRRGGWDYVGLRADGFYSYFNAYLGRPGVDEETKPVPLVRFPMEPGRRWTWHEPWRGQIMSTPGHDLDTSTWGSDCTAVIEKEEEVRVPAGTFKAIRVKIERRGKEPASSDMIAWYAKGVGLVKRESRRPSDNKRTSSMELTAFTPGESKPADVVSLVRRVAGTGVPLHEIALSGGAFRSRFVAASKKGFHIALYRVAGRNATPFRPASPVDWNRLLAEENVPRPTAPGGMEVEMTLDMGRLIAEGQGFVTDARTEVTSFEIRGSATKEIRYAVNGNYQGRPAWRVNVQMQVSKQGEILSLKTNSLRY